MMTTMNYKKGIIAAVSGSFVWGILPIYWKSLVPIPSSVIIFYRIFWVGVVSFIVSWKLYGMDRIKEPLKDKKKVARLILAGVINTSNWSIYIWAVNAGYVIQTSIGYYMEPLVVCLFGILFFKERFTKFNVTAMLMALAGVVIMIINSGQIPAIALSLAITFATYAAIKKSVKLEPMVSLAYETVLLVPIALAVIIVMEINGIGAIGVGETYQYALLMLAGVATAIPLGLFALGANNLPLITLGVTQYVSPTVALLLGVFMFGEPFDIVQFLAFAVTWIGLVIFTIGEAKAGKSGKES